MYCLCQTPSGAVSPRGDHSGWDPAARQLPREFDTINSHTIMFDPDYNMMPPFFPQQPIFCSLKAIESLNRKESQSPLPCHHVISAASIAVASTPFAERRVLVLAGDWACEIELHQTASSASCGDNEVDHAVCLKAEFQMHTVLSNENGKFYTTMIYPCFSRSVYFSMGSHAWWFGLCSSGSSLVSR